MSEFRTRSRYGARLAGLAVLALSGSAHAADPRAVVELFTSQGCSSCPPADRLLGDLASDPSIIALTMPIDYWDYLGWKDTLADARFTARQKAYSKMRGDRDVFTPQAVINGGIQVIGSDRAAIDGAIQASHAATPATMAVPVEIQQVGNLINVGIAAKDGARGEVWICAVSRTVPIAIGRGENRGEHITYHNVVRSWLKVGEFTGAANQWSVPLENIARDGVDAAVVLVQHGSPERPGPMLGAAFATLR